MENNIQQPKSSVRNNIMISFFIIILLMGISITWILQKTLQTNLTEKELDKAIVDKIISQYIVTSIGVSITAMILSLVIAYMLSMTITKPIRELIVGAEKIRRGDLNHRVPVRSQDEFGILALTCNQMMDDLKKSRAELEKYNKELEKRVKQRTKELEEKNTVLERFYRLTIGRELRMIELKKRIRELEEKLKNVNTKTKGG